MSIGTVELDEAERRPFAIGWRRGANIVRTADSIECTLRPGDSVTFDLEFRPTGRAAFHVEAPIRVRGERGDGSFDRLRLHGESPVGTVDVEPTVMRLTPVPLGVRTEERFKIRARHLESSTLLRPRFTSTTPRRHGDREQELLRVELPNGGVVTPGA